LNTPGQDEKRKNLDRGASAPRPGPLKGDGGKLRKKKNGGKGGKKKKKNAAGAAMPSFNAGDNLGRREKRKKQPETPKEGNKEKE